VQSCFPGATLEVFGSFATGLHLPTSDVDCVIMGAGAAHVPTALKELGLRLKPLDWVEGLQARLAAQR